jgi:uncharacterized membrane protein
MFTNNTYVQTVNSSTKQVACLEPGTTSSCVIYILLCIYKYVCSEYMYKCCSNTIGLTLQLPVVSKTVLQLQSQHTFYSSVCSGHVCTWFCMNTCVYMLFTFALGTPDTLCYTLLPSHPPAESLCDSCDTHAHCDYSLHTTTIY